MATGAATLPGRGPRPIGVGPMIRVTRLNGSEFVLNSDLIESVEATPDTVVTLTSGKKLIVREPVDEVLARVVEFRRRSLPQVIEREDLADS